MVVRARPCVLVLSRVVLVVPVFVVFRCVLLPRLVTIVLVLLGCVVLAMLVVLFRVLAVLCVVVLVLSRVVLTSPAMIYRTIGSSTNSANRRGMSIIALL